MSAEAILIAGKALIWFAIPLAIAFPPTLLALPGGSPVCEVFADYSNVFGMTNRPRNPNPGPYELTADVEKYSASEPVEITISGDPFVGLMFTVIDDKGNKVGTFSEDSQVGFCGGKAMSVTHSGTLSLSSKTLVWIPPEASAGTVYVVGYILEGEPGTGSAQNFYRFVRDDNSALAIEPQIDVIFEDSFASTPPGLS
ncbi:MAG: Reeler domain-containing protein [Wenzhouxiangella sp.]|jgi:hypothetical protein|nr:Reeler domain-containing protein [Wenzhouxiangella sp.]